jgi:hypothetical protein
MSVNKPDILDQHKFKQMKILDHLAEIWGQKDLSKGSAANKHYLCYQQNNLI